MSVQMKPKDRKRMLLAAAVVVARRRGGWASLTRAGIALEANCSDALVSRYLGGMGEVRRAVMARAIRYDCFDLIAQGIAAGYPKCLTLSSELQRKALATLGK